jgi:hypothetical protein
MVERCQASALRVFYGVLPQVHVVLKNVIKTLHLLVKSKFNALRSKYNLASFDLKIISVDEPQLAP